jgi:hypothetical protein
MGRAMASSSKEEEILAAAVAGIPRVAEVVASIPSEHGLRGTALAGCVSLCGVLQYDLVLSHGNAAGWLVVDVARVICNADHHWACVPL